MASSCEQQQEEKRQLQDEQVAAHRVDVVAKYASIRPHRRLAHLRLPGPPPHVLDLMRTERTHFYPQHWLLCHMGLY